MTAVEIDFGGLTSVFRRLRQGEILKCPRSIWKESSAYESMTRTVAHEFSVERGILELLGEHPGIVRYLGWDDITKGLILAEASEGSLEGYLNKYNETIPARVRQKWCLQVVEGLAYIHSRGVIHSDLRPDNVLIHATTPDSLDIWLCDFGGLMCDKLGLDGGHLPDSGFYDPNADPVSTPAMDIFSVGSILYSILIGHWLYRKQRGSFGNGERMSYGEEADRLFRAREFPSVERLFGGVVILGCWTRKYSSAKDVLEDLNLVGIE
ncbi:uncharacterized protein DNG_08115 [Cephalotrichum gorgonifer]|uniref:EKC/KEOPS complex subunit BUD32 n=1 Tax=Cephalotrichum gorgonifer TaxID=2041049 RepID=A0AAE8SY70_9PEZI|nr:uncharacterized protein DNG_08115 [Cephalotrichum gorgonifer]